MRKQTINKFLSRFVVGVSQGVQVKIADVTARVTSRDFCKDVIEFFHEVGLVMIWFQNGFCHLNQNVLTFRKRFIE